MKIHWFSLNKTKIIIILFCFTIIILFLWSNAIRHVMNTYQPHWQMCDSGTIPQYHRSPHTHIDLRGGSVHPWWPASNLGWCAIVVSSSTSFNCIFVVFDYNQAFVCWWGRSLFPRETSGLDVNSALQDTICGLTHLQCGSLIGCDCSI